MLGVWVKAMTDTGLPHPEEYYSEGESYDIPDCHTLKSTAVMVKAMTYLTATP